MGTAAADPATRRAYGQVHRIDGQIALTDLTTTSFSDVQSRYFRLFTPVKRERLRLPTSLREFHALRHFATLSTVQSLRHISSGATGPTIISRRSSI
jgi:hypothetical protein